MLLGVYLMADSICAGMAVALGTDFNPNAYCMSMVSVFHFLGVGVCGGKSGLVSNTPHLLLR